MILAEDFSDFRKSGIFQYKRSSDFYCSINSLENFELSTYLSDREILPHLLLMMKSINPSCWIVQTQRAQMVKIILDHTKEKKTYGDLFRHRELR